MNQIPTGENCNGCPCLGWEKAGWGHGEGSDPVCELKMGYIQRSLCRPFKVTKARQCLEQQPQIMGEEELQTIIRDATEALQRDKEFLRKELNKLKGG